MILLSIFGLSLEVTLDTNDNLRRVRQVVDFGRDTEDLYDADRTRRVLCISGQLLPRNKELYPRAVNFHLLQHGRDAEHFKEIVPIMWHSNS